MTPHYAHYGGNFGRRGGRDRILSVAPPKHHPSLWRPYNLLALPRRRPQLSHFLLLVGLSPIFGSLGGAVSKWAINVSRTFAAGDAAPLRTALRPRNDSAIAANFGVQCIYHRAKATLTLHRGYCKMQTRTLLSKINYCRYIGWASRQQLHSVGFDLLVPLSA